MNAKDVLVRGMDSSERIVNLYLDDLTDADLLLRPVDGMNHIAWQLGHLISSERSMIEGIKPGSAPALPEGFVQNHSREATTSDDPSKFATKAEYLSLMKAQREATRRLLDETSEADLDAPAPERMRRMCPTVGAVFGLVGNHVTMHVGQWVAVRRKLGKPVTM